MKKLLISLLFPTIVFSQELTTDNLITNGTFDDGTTGWTLSGDTQRINDCCPGGHDIEFGDSGSIEQSFLLHSNTITQPMLDNGLSLNSQVEIQNGEGGANGWCNGCGDADSFTIRLQLYDVNNSLLSETTQTRTDTTSIYGKYFTDTLTYTGTGSYTGNIKISGTDAAAPARLGGPNVDNVSVTMTYDDTVLSAMETAILNTAFEEIEEVLTTIEPEELFVYEEFIIEEILPFEETQIATEIFSEVYVEEVAVEEINTGIVSIFQEITYEEPTTIEEVSTEVESFEEVAEVREESETIEETEVATESGSTSESGNANVSSETNAPTGESNEETTVASREESPVDTETNTDAGTGEDNNTEAEALDNEPVQVTVEDIRRRVENTVNSVDQKLVATQLIVARIMSNNDTISTYNSINNDIFQNQPFIDGGTYDETRRYFDDRDLYAQNQNIYNDVMDNRQEQIEQANDEVIRAEEHLRRIRGY